MSRTFDVVLKGGTVVNHDGVGVRDVGVAEGASPPSASRWRARPAR